MLGERKKGSTTTKEIIQIRREVKRGKPEKKETSCAEKTKGDAKGWGRKNGFQKRLGSKRKYNHIAHWGDVD